jgi:alpha-L-fucosidase
MIFTAKHHDGFAMFDSDVSDYNIADWARFGRDPIRELAEACAEAGIRFGVYYSHREDWDHPYAYGNTWDFETSQTNLDTMDSPALFRRYLDEKAIPQLKELLTGYGPIGIVWFDRGLYTQEQGREFVELVHTLQPGCLVNGRVGHYDQELLGDYQSLTDNGMPAGGIEEYWETPQTMNDTWGYSRFDSNWKSPREIVRRLVSVVSKGGNYLLNVGPTGEGLFPGPAVEILAEVGKWIRENGESIYGTAPSPFPREIPWGACTAKGNRLYLHVFERPADGSLELTGLRNRIESARPLAAPDIRLEIQTGKGRPPSVLLPPSLPGGLDLVVAVDLDGEPDVEPFIIRQEVGRPVLLDYLTAATTGKAVKRFNRKGESGQFHISKMRGPDDRIEWRAEIVSPGRYEVLITYAAIRGWENGGYVFEAAGEKIPGRVYSSDGWYEYRTERIGRIDLKARGVQIFRIYPEKPLGHSLMYFKSLELVPVK